MAGVSIPTLSHFEKGKREIQLSTALSILKALGMYDERSLHFPQPNNGYYDYGRGAVIFTAQDSDKRIQVAIEKEVLEDYFKGSGRDLLKVFQANREHIEHEARRKYLSESFETDGSILLKAADLEL